MAIFYLLIFIGIVLGFVGFFYWLGWFKDLPFAHLGGFNFVEFFKNYPLIEKIAIGVGGLIVLTAFLFLSWGLILIYDKNWRRIFFKLLAFFGFLHFLGWLLYYFSILR